MNDPYRIYYGVILREEFHTVDPLEMFFIKGDMGRS